MEINDNMIDNKTTDLDNMLNTINSEKDLNNYIKNNLSPMPKLTFISYIETLRVDKKISKSKLIADADINRTYGYQILNGLKKPSRNNVIKLCLACKLSIDEANRCLTLAGFNKLYSKDVRDALITYFINNSYSVIDADLKLDELGLEPLGNVE